MPMSISMRMGGERSIGVDVLHCDLPCDRFCEVVPSTSVTGAIMPQETSIYFQNVEARAIKSGKTLREVIAEDKAAALDMSRVTENCLLPNEAEDLLRAGVKPVSPLVLDVAALPMELREAGEHVLECNFCKALLRVMEP